MIRIIIALSFISLKVQAVDKQSFEQLSRVTHCDFYLLAKSAVSNETNFPLCILSWVNENRTSIGAEFLKSVEGDLLSACQQISNQNETVCREVFARRSEENKNRLAKPLHIARKQDQQLALQIFLYFVLSPSSNGNASVDSGFSESSRELAMDLAEYWRTKFSPRTDLNQDLRAFLKRRIAQRLGR